MSHKILGQGSFGCVVSPIIPCKNKKSLDKFDATKIVNFNEMRKNIVQNEINISKRLLKLKSETFNPHDYFCLILDSCDIDIHLLYKKFEYLANSCGLHYDTKYKGLHSNYCGVDMFYEPSKKKIFKKLDNPKIMRQNIHNLLTGLKILKENKILCADIKPENLMIKDNRIKFLDFGGSLIITPKLVPKTRIAFTVGFIPFEAAFYFLQNEHTFFDGLLDHILKITDYNNSINGLDYETAYSLLQDLIYDNKFSKNYYKENIYKYDIYSLGVSLINIIRFCPNALKNNELFSLLNYMLKADYRKRYSVEECLNHPYFKNIKSLPVSKKPVKKSPVKKPPVKKPVTKKQPVKKPVTKKPVKKPVSKKPVKKPVSKKPVVKASRKKVIRIKPKVNPNTQIKKRKTRSNKGKPRGKRNKEVIVTITKKKRKTRSNKGVPRGPRNKYVLS